MMTSNSLQHVKGIIFDFDNTLVNTKGANELALEEVMFCISFEFVGCTGTGCATSDVFTNRT